MSRIVVEIYVMNTRASILSALTVSLITLFVAAAPQRARAQATIFTLTDVVFDDGTDRKSVV